MTQNAVKYGANGPTARAPTLQMISSFEKKPANGQTPAIASVPIHIVIHVIGIHRRSPPMFRMSWASQSRCVWWNASCMAWITAPEPRNSRALKNACVMRWKTPAAYAPTPTPTNM